MGVNQIVPFATGAGANVQPAAVYAASAAVQTGVQPGVADPQQANTSWRQASVVASMIAQFIVDHANVDVLDDGNVAGLEAKFLAAIEALIPAATTISGTEGVAVTSGVAQLNVPGLTEEDTIAQTDNVPYFSAADGHHRKTTISALAAALGSSSSLTNIFVTKGTPADLALFNLAAAQAVNRNVYSLVGVSGSNPAFGTMSGGTLTITQAGKYMITGTLVSTSNQPSGELEYVVAYLYKNGAQITSALTANYSFGSSSTGLSCAAPAILAVGDTVQLVVFMHSSSNDDTSDTVVAGGATTLAIMKVG